MGGKRLVLVSSGKAGGTTRRRQRSSLRVRCALGLGTIVFAHAMPGTGLAIELPTITVGPIKVVIPDVAATVTQSVGQTAAAVAATTQGVSEQVQAVQAVPALAAAANVAAAIHLPDIPAVANGVAVGHIAAGATAAVEALARNQIASIPVAAAGGHGLAALVGSARATAGHLQVRTGAVTLASGTALTVDFYGDGLINFAVDGPAAVAVLGAGRGTAFADGGTVTLAAAAASAVVDNAINLGGVVTSQAIAVNEGRVALITGEVADVVVGSNVTDRHNRVDPLTAILADTEFQPGGYTGTGSVRYDHSGTAATPGADPARGWSRDVTVLFGSVAGRSDARHPRGDGSEQSAKPTTGFPSRTEAVTPVGIILGASESLDEGEEGADDALSLLNQIETLVGHEDLTPTDVCQAAGGGGVGLPGCGGSEVFGAVVTLEPDETGAGCALTGASGGFQLFCGGGSEPFVTGEPGVHMPLPAIDSTQTLQDMLDLWLQPPASSVRTPLV